MRVTCFLNGGTNPLENPYEAPRCRYRLMWWFWRRLHCFLRRPINHAQGLHLNARPSLPRHRNHRNPRLSLKSQELTALFLAVRLYCSFVMEFDIHTLLDSATLVTTLWVIYMIRFKLKASYMEDKDNFAIYYVVIPFAVLSVLIHPSTHHHIINKISWAFCVYLHSL